MPRCRGCSALEDADAAVAEVLAEWRRAFGKAVMQCLVGVRWVFQNFRQGPREPLVC